MMRSKPPCARLCHTELRATEGWLRANRSVCAMSCCCCDLSRDGRARTRHTRSRFKINTVGTYAQPAVTAMFGTVCMRYHGVV